jgi:Tfp pilus assembly protein PilF
MSLILDALRRGRPRQSPAPAAKSAHTDAVLATLGYGKFSPSSPFNRFKRLLGYAGAGVLLAVVLWAVVVFATQNYLGFRPKAEARPLAQVSRPVLRASPKPADIVPAPAGPIASNTESLPSSSRTVPVVAANQAPAAATPTRSTAHDSGRPGGDRMPAAPKGTPSNNVLTPAARVSVISKPDDHFALAVYNQRAGNFEEALVHYRAVLQRDELNAEAHNNLGVLYRDKGLLLEAAKELQRAIAINPRYGRAHNNLGVVYLGQKKLDAATAEFREALSFEPRNIEALVNLAIAEREGGRRDAARTALNRALELDVSHADAHYNLALVEDEAGNTAAAIKHYRAFLQFGNAAHADLMADVRKRVDALNR